MVIKWINKIRFWWRDYRIWVRNVENIFIIGSLIIFPAMLIILFGGNSYQSLVKINYTQGSYIEPRVNYVDALINPKKYEEGKLLERSAELSNVIYNQTDYLKDIKNATTKDEQDIVKQKILQLSTYYIGVVIIDKTTGDYYSNRSWFYDPPYALSTPKNIIQELAKNENLTYITLNPAEDIEEIYFYQGEMYIQEVNAIRTSFFILLICTIILVVFLVKKIYMIKNLGFKKYKISLKQGYLFKLFRAIRAIFKTRIIVEEIIKDKVFLFIIFATIIYLLFWWIASAIDFWLGYPSGYSYVYYVGIGVGIAIIVFLFVHFIIKYILKYDSLATIIYDIDEIKKGNMELEVEYGNDKQISELAKGINDLRLNYKDSIEEGIRNEKLKTELISNVSHDLKTPLTSIINYVNILQRDDISEDEKKECIKILETKSHRLKRLIDDLFEVSKMNSGKVDLYEMDIDIIQLIYQSIMEVEDLYIEKKMEFKVKAPDELKINVDPEKMSRVFQNLATNSLKYGLENTRIYVDIKDFDDRAEISFKNVSAFELDFNESQILERFARGDKSRNSTIEGSGLGLAIAKTIVELHEGLFKVECEGDLFKAYVILPKTKLK